MSNDPLYDPDRVVFEDLDLTDKEAVKAYLDHPVTAALTNDYGREFRRLPAAEQQSTLDDMLRQNKQRRAELVQAMDGFAPEAPARVAQQMLLEALDTQFGALTLRLLELDGTD